MRTHKAAVTAIAAMRLVRGRGYLAQKGLGPMLTLSEDQLATVMTAADKLPVEKRGVFLERVVARLGLHPRFTAAEFDKAIQVALHGVLHGKTAA